MEEKIEQSSNDRTGPKGGVWNDYSELAVISQCVESDDSGLIPVIRLTKQSYQRHHGQSDASV